VTAVAAIGLLTIGLVFQTAEARPAHQVVTAAAGFPQPPKAAKFIQVSVGSDGFACGLKTNHQVVCWGSNDPALRPPSTGTFDQVTVGGGYVKPYVCALSAAQVGKRSIVCWGGWRPKNVPAGNFSQISAGTEGARMCVLQGDPGKPGTVLCWGRDRSTPSGKFTQMSVGEPWCFLKADGSAVCSTGWNVPKSRPGPFTQIAGGSYTGLCAVGTKGKLSCWGFWTGNILGTAVYTQVADGFYEVCGVLKSGPIKCMRSKPPAGVYKQVSVGVHSHCGLKTNGLAVCWS
jgi:hypothetical protein